MLTWLPWMSGVLAFVCMLVATPLVIRLAYHKNWVSHPQADRWHQRPTALMGGIAIYAAATVAFLAFAVVMTGFIYPMEGNWTWGEKAVFGMYTLGDLGFSDFAGSGIVHMAGGAAALAGVLLLGARKGKYGPDGSVNAIPGANLPIATLGMFILWMGWFGFNGGSVLATASVESANAVAVVFMNTNAAAAGGLITALLRRALSSVKRTSPCL